VRGSDGAVRGNSILAAAVELRERLLDAREHTFDAVRHLGAAAATAARHRLSTSATARAAQGGVGDAGSIVEIET